MQVSGLQPAARRAAIRLLVTVVLALVSGNATRAGIIVVSGTANPLLADRQIAATNPLDGTLPPFFDLTKNNYGTLNILTFGTAAPAPTLKTSSFVASAINTVFAPGPDGGSALAASGPSGLISGFDLPANSLVGVFWGPNLATAPGLAKSSPTAIDYSPQLGQIFFIGDGLNGTGIGSIQNFHVPAGATRLFFGTANSSNWAESQGVIQVFVTKAVPEPSTAFLMLVGLATCVARVRRRTV